LGGGSETIIAFGAQNSARQGDSVSEHVTPTLDKSKTPGITDGMAVRRLTPRECERLQGFPDDYTLIPYRNKLAADGPRYKAMGNSMAVPVMRWIGERIEMVEQYA
jgi:DNA (cytosine-5)-methyltransferase 1